MKYQRLVLRYDDRVSGSTFSEPQFRVNLLVPYDKPVKVHLESAFINADQSTSVNDSYVRISLKNAVANNAVVSKNGGFIYEGVLGRVGFSDANGSTHNLYNMNNNFSDPNGALICFPNQVFKLGILDLLLTYGDKDSNPIVQASTGGGDADLDNYCIVLGVYCDEYDD